MTTFLIDAAALTEVCTWVGRIIPARPTQPPLAGLLLEAVGPGDDPGGDAAEGLLHVRGYDGDVAAFATVGAAVTEPGTMLVSARLLGAISSALSGGRRPVQISIGVEGTRACVRAGRSEWTLPLMDPTLYPELPARGEQIGVVDAAVLARGIGQVLPAAANDITQHSICGVRVEADTAGTLTLAATDRYRIAATELEWTAKTTAAGPDANGLLLAETLPLTLVDLVRSAFDAGQVDIHLGAGIAFAGDRRTVIGRPIGEQFLPWRKKLNPDPDHWVELDADELIYALDQALALGETTIALDFTHDGEVEISAQGEVGTARALSPVTALIGEPLRLTLNAGFLRDGVVAAGARSVRVHLGTNGRAPILLLDSAGGAFRYLTIPIRT